MSFWVITAEIGQFLQKNQFIGNFWAKIGSKWAKSVPFWATGDPPGQLETPTK